MIISSTTSVKVNTRLTAKDLIKFLLKVPEDATVSVESDPSNSMSEIVLDWTEIKED